MLRYCQGVAHCWGRLVEVDNETSAAAGRETYFKGQTVQSFGEALYVYTREALPIPRYRRSFPVGHRYALMSGSKTKSWRPKCSGSWRVRSMTRICGAIERYSSRARICRSRTPCRLRGSGEQSQNSTSPARSSCVLRRLLEKIALPLPRHRR